VIHVILVDDQTLVRRGIESLLALTPDIRVVAHAADGEEGLRVVTSTAADVILLDVRMPKKTGLQMLEAMADGKVNVPAILLTTFDDDAVVFDGVRLGARGFLLKDVSLEQLAEAIRVVAGGGTLINPAVTERVLKGIGRLRKAPDLGSATGTLTTRELEVLRLMAAGASNREIAETLGTAEGTVKNQASSIMSKLGVRDRTRAVLKALELGYL
jgi:DNA-binding NarL/FixJ family response regulator